MSEPSISEELLRLAELRDRGILTEAEFQQQKAKLLGNTAQTPPPYQTAQPTPASQPVVRKESKDNSSIGLVAGIMIGLAGLVGVGIYSLNPHKPQSNTQQSAPTASSPSDTAKTANNAASNPIATTAASDASEQAAAQQELLAAQARYTDINQKINNLWKSFDSDVRAYLKKDQTAFNQAKEAQCTQASADSAAANETQQQIIRLNCLSDSTEARIPVLQAAAQTIQPQLLQNRLESAKTSNQAALDEYFSLSDRLPATVREQLQSDPQTWIDEARSKCSAPSDTSTPTETAIASLNCFTKLLKAKNAELKDYAI